jgi:hypothetical protein
MAITGNQFLDAILKGAALSNPATAPLVIGQEILDKFGAKAPAKPAAKPPQQTPSTGGPTVPPIEPGSVDAGSPDLPAQQDLPQGAPNLGSVQDIFTAILKQQAAEQEAARKFYPERAATDYGYWQKREEIARQNALERMEEKTRRDVELQTIDAWQKVTTADINRDAILAGSMLQLSATMGMPNPNVLNAGANLAQIGASAFKPGQSVF